MNVSKKKHTKMWLVLGLGLVFIPAWLLVLYLASLAIHDLLVDTLVVALALGILSYLLSKVLQVETQQEALVSGFAWAFLLFLVELLITLLRGTGDNVLNAVTKVPGTNQAWAVGSYYPIRFSANQFTLIERYA